MEGFFATGKSLTEVDAALIAHRGRGLRTGNRNRLVSANGYHPLEEKLWSSGPKVPCSPYDVHKSSHNGAEETPCEHDSFSNLLAVNDLGRRSYEPFSVFTGIGSSKNGLLVFLEGKWAVFPKDPWRVLKQLNVKRG